MIETFGCRLKRLRNQCNLSQEQLATIVGVDRSAISYYENDERQPPLATLVQLARTLQVTTDYLLGASNDTTLKTDGLTASDIETIKYMIRRFSEANKNNNND